MRENLKSCKTNVNLPSGNSIYLHLDTQAILFSMFPLLKECLQNYSTNVDNTRKTSALHERNLNKNNHEFVIYESYVSSEWQRDYILTARRL